MATNVTKTSHFTSGAGNPISFSQIKAQFGGNTSNSIKASTYLRNTGDDVDWDGPNASSIMPRIPDATENDDIASQNNWSVDSLRDTITGYTVTQSGSSEELVYYDSDTSTWNGNLNRNVLKKFDVTGTIFANQTNKDALTFDGNLYNLEIEVEPAGKIYGEGGGSGGGAGGDALYVRNIKNNSDVEIRSYGSIWAGGGGGRPGNSGNRGGDLNCYVTNYFSTDNPFRTRANGGTNLTFNEMKPGQSCRRRKTNPTWANYVQGSANPTGTRNRCRGGSTRRGQGGWNGYNGYQCSENWHMLCKQVSANPEPGGNGGSGGAGGSGRGFSNQFGSISGSPGNRGNTNSCSGSSSTGNSGNPGSSGGDWGQAAGGPAGKSIQKRNARVEYYTNNTVKGLITNI